MKSFFTIIFLLFSTHTDLSVQAASFSSFYSNKTYHGDGRWYKNGYTFIFRINEGTANVENIIFKRNALQLDHQVKYKLCFKIVKDCHLDCTADLIKEISVINPWEEAQIWVPRADGSYPYIKESTCK